MKSIGGDGGYHFRLTDEAYAGWKVLAEREGMTTAGLLEMVGRQIAAKRPGVVADAVRASSAGRHAD